MSKDFCMDCGMLLSPHTSICAVCGFDNSFDDFSDIALDIDQLVDLNEEFVPDHYPGF
jgi:RNA polymerase subunit RPABC4/transcription elongation factor Spt4